MTIFSLGVSRLSAPRYDDTQSTGSWAGISPEVSNVITLPNDKNVSITNTDILVFSLDEDDKIYEDIIPLT